METWAARARQRGAIIATAASFSQDRKARPFARLGFASLDCQEILEGVRRLAAACPRRNRPAERPSRNGEAPA